MHLAAAVETPFLFQGFYIESDDPYKEGVPGANFSFKYSYGDPQPVHVLAKEYGADEEAVWDAIRCELALEAA